MLKCNNVSASESTGPENFYMLHLLTEAVMVKDRRHDATVACCTPHGGKILTIFSPKMIKVRECVSMHQGAHAVCNEIRSIRAALH